MNVAIIGLGNIGTVFAAHLSTAAIHRVYACVRRKPEPLVVEGHFGSISGEVEWFDRPEDVPPADWILIATKAHQTAGAAIWLTRLIQKHTRIVLLQNGVDAEARVEPYRNGATVIPTVVYTNSKRLGPGQVRHLRPEYDLAVPPSNDARELIDLFAGTAIRIEEEPEFLTAAWRKFLINLAANPLTAIIGRGIGSLRGPRMEEVAIRLLEEAAMVGRAEGANLGPKIAREVLDWMSTFPANTGTSMLEDRLAGRELETDAMTGTILRLGLKHGIALPVNEMIMALLTAMSGHD